MLQNDLYLDFTRKGPDYLAEDVLRILTSTMDDHEKTLAEHAERPRMSTVTSTPRPSDRRASHSGSRRASHSGSRRATAPAASHHHSSSFRRPSSRSSSRRAVAAVAAAATRHSSFRRTSRSSSRRPSSQAPRPSGGGGGAARAGQEHQSFLDYLRRETLRPPPRIELDLKDFEETFSTFTPTDGDDKHDWHDESALGGSSSREHPPLPPLTTPHNRLGSPEPPYREESHSEPRPASPYEWEGWVDEQDAAIRAAPPPDGGARAWLAVLGAWCCLFCTFGWISCIGTFQAQYQHDELKEYSSSAVAWITSMETCVVFLCMPIQERLYNALGPVPLVCGGAFLHVFGLMMASLSTKYYQFMLSQSICSAIGASAILTAGVSAVGSWFQGRRALVFWIVASGSPVGGCILSIIVTRVSAEVSFGWALRICAFLFLFLLTIACFTLRSRVKPEPRVWAPGSLMRLLLEPAFVLTALGLTMFTGAMFIPFNYIVLEAENRGLSKGLASYTISALNAASLFGRVLPAWAADYYGKFNVMIIATALSVIIVLGMWVPSHDAPSTVGVTFGFAVLFGCASGAFLSMIPVLIQQLSTIQEVGSRLGATYGIISIAVLTFNPIAGALVQADGGGYLWAKIFTGLAMAVGCCLLIAARVVQAGWALVRI